MVSSFPQHGLYWQLHLLWRIFLVLFSGEVLPLHEPQSSVRRGRMVGKSQAPENQSRKTACGDEIMELECLLAVPLLMVKLINTLSI